MSAKTYEGDGSFFVGVPARDLTAAEAALYASIITGSSLYADVQGQGAPAPQAAPEPEAAPTGAPTGAPAGAPSESARKRKE